jgi:hypothetical protein
MRPWGLSRNYVKRKSWGVKGMIDDELKDLFTRTGSLRPAEPEDHAAAESEGHSAADPVPASPAQPDARKDVRLVLAVAAGELHASVLMLCPFGAGVGVQEYASVSEVPAWWPCTCGAEHSFSAHDAEVVFRRPSNA